MKIAFVNITANLVNRGAETYVKELSKRLSEENTVDIFAGKSIPPKRWPILWMFGIDPNGLTILWFSLGIFRKIVNGKYDYVIAVDGMWESLLIRIATWMGGSKLVVSGQSGVGFDDRVNLLVFPDIFIGITEDAVDWARRTNPFVKSIYIPNGVDLTKFSPNRPALKTNLNSEKPTVICVAALTRQKRQELIIRAVAKTDKYNLLLVGDGELKDQINALGSDLLGSRFHLTKLPFEKVPDAYRVADVFVFVPEPSESFGIVYLEAMASGLPVVAINDAKRRGIVGCAGVFVNNPKDPGELYEAIEEAVRGDYKKHSLSQAKLYSWEKIASEYTKLFTNFK